MLLLKKIGPYNINKMTGNDLEEYFSDFLHLFAENTRGHVIDQYIADDYILQKAKEIFIYLKEDTAILLGIFNENLLIGFLWSYPRIFLEEKRIYINALIVNDKYRGQGLGQLLILELENIAKEMKIYAIDVSTASFKTRAIKFYEGLGFQHERVQLRKPLSESENRI